ncbi:hypothetical protein LSAT2_001065 [Lamellibrachia satsuma]|nr:hypothetical protein LSAT2_001065 [Lamellibrachia satsuma]
MDIAVALLKKYAGRDKIMRTVCYTSLMLTGPMRGKIARDLTVLAKQISTARMITRLFEDMPSWVTTQGYGIGEHERDQVIRILSIIGNAATQLFLPVEHLVWACDSQIVPCSSRPWAVTTIVLWLISLVSNIVKSIRLLVVIQYKQINLVKRKRLESPGRSDGSSVEFRRQFAILSEQRRKELLDLVKNVADAVMAINWLPAGILWGGKLSPAKNAVFGTLSSVIGLYTLVQEEKNTQSWEKQL